MSDWKPAPDVALTQAIMEAVGKYTHVRECSCEHNWTCAHCYLWFEIYGLINKHVRPRDPEPQSTT